MSLENNMYLGRWLRLLRYTPEQVRDLHSAERAAHDRWNANRDRFQPENPADQASRQEANAKNRDARGDGWLIAGTRVQRGYDRNLDDYWDKRKTDVAREIERFEAFIYPIWKPLLEDTPANREKFKDEVAAIHAADLAILRAGATVNRGNTASAMPGGNLKELYGDQEGRKALTHHTEEYL